MEENKIKTSENTPLIVDFIKLIEEGYPPLLTVRLFVIKNIKIMEIITKKKRK